MRNTLWIGAAFNLVAAFMLFFPETLGRIAALPADGSRFYAWMLGALIGIFGFVYAWLARSPRIDRPLIVVAMLGKFAVVVVTCVTLVAGEIAMPTLGPAFGDLIFGLIFLWWLGGAEQSMCSATAAS
jgi:hypothetical protein